MFCRFRRPQHDKLAAVRHDHLGEVVAVVRRHMARDRNRGNRRRTCTTIRRAIQNHSDRIGSSCDTKPRSASLRGHHDCEIAVKISITSVLESQTIIAARNEIQIAAISEKLQLLANLRLYISVVRVELTQSILKCVDIVDLKLMFPDGFHALHHFYKPTPRFLSPVTQKQRSVPLREHRIFRFDFAVADNEDFAGLRDLVQQDMGANPARATGSRLLEAFAPQ